MPVQTGMDYNIKWLSILNSNGDAKYYNVKFGKILKIGIHAN